MTREEFDKISFIKSKIDILEKLLYGRDGDSECPRIYRLKVSYIHGEDDIDAPISRELYDDIIKLLEGRLEKLKTEFNNFKTE